MFACYRMSRGAQKDFDMGPFDVVPDFFRPYPKLSQQVMDGKNMVSMPNATCIPFLILSLRFVVVYSLSLRLCPPVFLIYFLLPFCRFNKQSIFRYEFNSSICI